MESWLLALITAVITTACTTMVSSIIKHKADKRAAEEKRREEEQAELKRKQSREELIAIIREEVRPLNDKIDYVNTKLDSLSRGVQGALRHDLYEICDKWLDKGYCPRDVKNDFENIYNCYHSLGKNGVMDGYHEQFMRLPDKETNNDNVDK